MKSSSSYEKALNSSFRFLSYRPRSKKEVFDNLVKKKYSQDTISQVLSFLEDRKFIDDREFAKWFIEQRTNQRPRAGRIIKFELERKGIKTEDFNENLDEEYIVAKRLLSKKKKMLDRASDDKKYEKAFNFLARAGFDFDLIKTILEEVNLTKKF